MNYPDRLERDRKEVRVKSVFVKQLQAGTEVFDQPFMLLDMVTRQTRDGRPFILFNLGDKSGKISGVFWNVPEEVVNDCAPGRVVLVTGDVRTYNQRLQVVALDLQPYEPEDMGDFAPTTERDRTEMIDELRRVVSSLREPLRELVSDILLEPELLRRFVEVPAAKTMHHAYIGGLVEHVLAMVRFCRLAGEQYPEVDQDLLITGALLHDVGKVYAYSTEASFPLTDEERLVGHITNGALMVRAAADKIDGFPADLRQQLLHVMVSHHGSMEWGSPVLPCTLEAVLLHQVDMLDSRARGFIDHVVGEPGDLPWTSRSPMFGYELMRGRLEQD